MDNWKLKAEVVVKLVMKRDTVNMTLITEPFSQLLKLLPLTIVPSVAHISLVMMLWFWEDFALVTHVLLINIYSLVIANHSVMNVNALYQSSIFYCNAVVYSMSVKTTSRAVRLKNYLRMLMQQQSWILSKKSTFIILFNDLCYCFPFYISYWSLVCTYHFISFAFTILHMLLHIRLLFISSSQHPTWIALYSLIVLMCR